MDTSVAGVPPLKIGQPRHICLCHKIVNKPLTAAMSWYYFRPHGQVNVEVVMDRVLVIDDDPAIQRALCRTFAAGGFEVFVAGDGAQAMDVVHAVKPHVVILDLFLPGRSGQDLCRAMKQESCRLPVIVLSAASDAVDKVLLLELGADDYVTKPFSPRELLARVRVAVRRLKQACDKPKVFKFGEIEVSFSAMELQRQGKYVPLTAQEFKILRFFVEKDRKSTRLNS